MDYQYLKNLEVPKDPVDVVLDTDAYNEVDDQFAIAYLLASGDKLHTKAFYAAPFYGNGKSESPADGMEKSYHEIIKILRLSGNTSYENCTYRGSESYLEDETTPVVSDAAKDLIRRALAYSPEKPLYVVAIGAITNVASALLMAPEIAKNIVVVWLGGNSREFCTTMEFNLSQDIAAARAVLSSGVSFVQLPCLGVVSSFSVSYTELAYHLKGKNALCNYLVENVREALKDRLGKSAASRIIWDVTAIGWLLNEGDRFMLAKVIPAPVPEYDYLYAQSSHAFIQYVYFIKREALMTDLFYKLTDGSCFDNL